MLTILADMMLTATRQTPADYRPRSMHEAEDKDREYRRRELAKAQLRGGAFSYW